MRRPQREPRTDLPGRVRIYEVGPRDGLQNEKTLVPVEVKAEFIRRLVGAGLDTVETTSFVPASWVPQLADAAVLLGLLGEVGRGRNRPVLVPSERGLDAALAQGAQAIAIFGSATESFARKNLNRGVQESIAMFAPVAQRALGEGLWVRAYLSMCFGDPWEGDVPIDQVVDVASRLMDLGCDELSLGDTIGTGTTGHVKRLLDALDSKGIGPERIGVHFHDTYGQALANTLAALGHGVTVVDVSAGGLGGCPYAKSATGNLATEDLVWALDGLGIETGVDLEALVETSVWMSRQLGRPSSSRVVRALARGSSDGGSGGGTDD
jgi:hydroxymethylglutaryl-CoA lyase